jgi:hypothetical protein
VAGIGQLKARRRLVRNTKALLAAAALALAGCGSSDWRPPPEGRGGIDTTIDGRYTGVVNPRARTLTVRDARTKRTVASTHVGVGPTGVVAFTRRFFVVDTRGNGLVEVHLRGDELVVHRRIHLAGRPRGIVWDRRRRHFRVRLTETGRVAVVATRRLLTVR